jgi:hypothetical protein
MSRNLPVKTRTETERKARLKGGVAAGSAAIGVALIVAGAPILGVIGLGLSGLAAWDWFRYRARNGMRF